MHIKTFKIKNKLKEKKSLKTFFVNNKLFTLLLIISVAGFITGNLILKNHTNSEFSKRIFETFQFNFKLRKSSTFFNSFTESIFSTFVFVIPIFLMGLSAWGVTLIPPVVFFKGYCAGAFNFFVLNTYSTKGILFSLFIVLPGFLISTFATILMSKEAIKLSNIFSSILLNINDWQNDEKIIRNYLIKTFCVLFLVSISALADVILNSIFFKFFNF